METDTRRYVMIDMAKGAGITLVVYGHCLRGLISAGFIPQDSPLIITDYIVYTFHMPLFFIASGLFFGRSLRKSNLDFWTNTFKNILYPYFFWSLLCGSIQFILSGSSATNSGMSASRLSEILWNPISPFWFLYALFFSYSIAWALKSITVEINILIGLCVLTISFYTMIGVVSDVFYGFTYFSLGMYIQKQRLIDLIPASYGAALGLVVMFFITAFASYFLGVPDRMAFISAVLGVIATATICRLIEHKLGNSPLVSTLSALGKYSMGIYVMHIIFIATIRTILLRIFMINSILAVMITAISCGLLFPLLIQNILVRFGINNLFGLPFSAVKINNTTTNHNISK